MQHTKRSLKFQIEILENQISISSMNLSSYYWRVFGKKKDLIICLYSSRFKKYLSAIFLWGMNFSSWLTSPYINNFSTIGLHLVGNLISLTIYRWDTPSRSIYSNLSFSKYTYYNCLLTISITISAFLEHLNLPIKRTEKSKTPKYCRSSVEIMLPYSVDSSFEW